MLYLSDFVKIKIIQLSITFGFSFLNQLPARRRIGKASRGIFCLRDFDKRFARIIVEKNDPWYQGIGNDMSVKR